MTLDDYLKIGETIALGSHLFTAEEIKAFARKYDPQIFHIDEEAAKDSVFGRLCASGWHSCAMWMRYNLQKRENLVESEWTGEGPEPQFGPSPGFTDLKWLKPIYAGDTITFTRTALKHRALASRPGWRLLTLDCGAHRADDGVKVLAFQSSVLVRTG